MNSRWREAHYARQLTVDSDADGGAAAEICCASFSTSDGPCADWWSPPDVRNSKRGESASGRLFFLPFFFFCSHFTIFDLFLWCCSALKAERLRWPSNGADLSRRVRHQSDEARSRLKKRKTFWFTASSFLIHCMFCIRFTTADLRLFRRNRKKSGAIPQISHGLPLASHVLPTH